MSEKARVEAEVKGRISLVFILNLGLNLNLGLKYATV